MSIFGENIHCRLSFLSQPHTLSHRDGDPQFCCFFCGKKEPNPNLNCGFFYCTTCNVEFHVECNMVPKKLLHPFHPQHPLILTVRNEGETQMIADYYDESNTSDSTSLNLNWFQGDIIFDECSWCGGNNAKTEAFYRCSICNFCLDLPCSQLSPPVTIHNPKSHHHSLLLLARPFPSPCDACGLILKSDPSYVCHQCNYVAHESCINLPRVIKITRHPHRLFHTSYLPPKVLLCRICYKKVDVKYGHYSCKHEDCSYVTHSKCATYENVWDGRELEWKPEEPDEDVSSFQSVGDDMIKHFCHDHNLKLEKYNGGRGIEKHCEACILPINLENYYNCLECDYSLHEVCAGLPKKIDHALHKHPLVLERSFNHAYNDCITCLRKSVGFTYRCYKDIGSSINIDVRCILVPDYFTHKSHKDPLFIFTTMGNDDIMCNGCKKKCKQSHMQCTLCKYALCYECVTIPNELYYKYDEHPLSLCFGEDTNDKYWCEVCEKELDPTEWFYTCNKCCITIHKECVFGSSIYMKSGSTLSPNIKRVKVFRSNMNFTRPICSYCDNRCVGFIYYKKRKSGKSFCSLLCLDNYMDAKRRRFPKRF